MKKEYSEKIEWLKSEAKFHSIEIVRIVKGQLSVFDTVTWEIINTFDVKIYFKNIKTNKETSLIMYEQRTKTPEEIFKYIKRKLKQ